MLTNKGFIRWAGENLVVLIAHNELGHDPVEVVGYDGRKTKGCPLYPGMTCREHVDAAVDIESTRDASLVTVPFIELCPNTWLVPPVGEPIRVVEKDQFSPAKIRKQVDALRKTWGPIVSASAYAQVLRALEQAEARADEDDFQGALRALAGIATHVPKPHEALRVLIRARVAAVDEPLGWAVDDIVEDDAPLPERIAAMQALRAKADVEVFGEAPKALAKIDAWLKANGG